jgi:hypothetical protein
MKASFFDKSLVADRAGASSGTGDPRCERASNTSALIVVALPCHYRSVPPKEAWVIRVEGGENSLPR